MSTEKDNYTLLTHAPVPKVILRMAVPTIISMLVTSFYGMVDTYFVGRLDTQSTAAVGVAFSVMALVQAVGFFFGHGSGNYISRCLGARETGKARCMAVTGFLYSVGGGALIALLGHLFLSPLCVALGSTPTVLPYAEAYLGIILYGTPFATASFTLNNQMRFQGNATLAMYGIVAGVVLNVALAPLFIFVCGMGIAGAGLATVTGQVVSFLILLYMTGRRGNISVRLADYRFSWFLIREMVAGGTPSLSRQGLASVAALMLNVAAARYGDAAVAGMSIVNRISNFVYAVVVGLGQGFQPLCGFCYGARLYGRVESGFRFCVKVGTVFFLVLSVAGLAFTEPIIGEFRDDAEVIRVGSAAFRWQLVTYPLIAVIILANMLLQTIRKPVRANIVAASRSGLFFIPAIIMLPRCLGLTGVEMCQAVSDVCAFLISVPLVWSAFREMRKERK